MKFSFASAFARFTRSFTGKGFAPRARRALLGATLAVTATSAATNVASIPYRIPEFPLSSFPDSPNVPRYDEFEFAEESHYPGPPKPPARYEWSDEAKNIFAAFEADGYVPLPFIYHPHSFIAGGHGVERRVRYHFLLKKGTIPAPGTPEAEAAAAAAAAAAAVTSRGDTTASPVPSSAPFARGGRPPAPTPADFGPEGNIMSLAGVVHFGPDAQGPKDCVHGGAIAALADSVMALAVASTGMACVTANLNVNYKNLIPLDTDAVLRVAVPALQGRKATVRFALFSPAKPGEEPKLYSEGSALFIMPRAWEGTTKKASAPKAE